LKTSNVRQLEEQPITRSQVCSMAGHATALERREVQLPDAGGVEKIALEVAPVSIRDVRSPNANSERSRFSAESPRDAENRGIASDSFAWIIEHTGSARTTKSATCRLLHEIRMLWVAERPVANGVGSSDGLQASSRSSESVGDQAIISEAADSQLRTNSVVASRRQVVANASDKRSADNERNPPQMLGPAVLLMWLHC
jgi:hypothetical protein